MSAPLRLHVSAEATPTELGWAGGLAADQHLMDRALRSAVPDQILSIEWDEDGADRWPIAYTVAFVVGASALLWALIIGALNWFIG